MLPYNLGLENPRDIVVVDPAGIPSLWGPGTVAPSQRFSEHWRGGAAEFYVPHPLPLGLVLDIYVVEACGDLHRHD
ncbi:MAG: hypothetical protein FJ035_06645 [Chloroflexi bacterium]|nr:hypothetical protein [Chloroflexota bacterium]